jgi:hypothetical protein
MWMAIGVGILLAAQAGATPAVVAPKEATVPGVNGADSDAPAVESPAAGTDTTLRFRNDVGNGFELTEARFTLDGRNLPVLLTSSMAHGQEYVIFSGPLSPGHHVLNSHVTYQGKSRSIFTYMKGYTVNLDSAHELNVAASGATTATIVGKPNKGFNVPFERSLMVEMEQTNGSGGTVTNQASSGYRPPR